MKNEIFEKMSAIITREKMAGFLEHIKALSEATEKVGIKVAVTDYLYENAAYDQDNRLPCGETVANAAEDIIRFASLYVNSRYRSITDEDILRIIEERSANYEGKEKTEYLASVLFAQNYFSGKYADMQEDALRLEYTKLVSGLANEEDEETANRIRSRIDAKTIRNCLELTESDDYLATLRNGSPEGEEKLLEMFEGYPTAEQHAIRCAIIYSEITQGRIPDINSDLHPTIVSATVCGAGDAAKVIEDERFGSITVEEAEARLNIIEVIVVGLVALAVTAAGTFGPFIVTIIIAKAITDIVITSEILILFAGIFCYILVLLGGFSMVYALVKIIEEGSFDYVFELTEEIALVFKKRFTIPLKEKLAGYFEMKKAAKRNAAEAETCKTAEAPTVSTPICV